MIDRMPERSEDRLVCCDVVVCFEALMERTRFCPVPLDSRHYARGEKDAGMTWWDGERICKCVVMNVL